MTRLLELLQSPGADMQFSLLNAVAEVLTVLPKGKEPKSLSSWIAGASLTALRKPDDVVKPIAVVEIIKRLIRSLLLARNAERAKGILIPHHIGTAVPGGCEAAIHTVRQLSHQYGHDIRYWLLQVDFRNSFKLVSLASFRKEVRKRILELHNVVQYCCSSDTAT